MPQLNRRDFIRSAGLAFGSILLFPSCLKTPAVYRFFTTEEALAVIALAEQIIPNDGFPGATDAEVIHYIDRQLAGVFHYDQDTYRKGIGNLQSFCQKKFGQRFELLTADQQISVMKQMESNQIDDSDWPETKPSDFFNLIRSHTMQGFYGSPIHGGNKDFMSFEMLRIDYPLVIGQNRYRS